jgi:(heptosyl)LPS beta-1,4-glucosyltransferase
LNQPATEGLSVTIITLNKEENIRDCLESVKWADEIIVIDSESTDKTADICKEYTEKVYLEREWHDFGKQRHLKYSTLMPIKGWHQS